MHWDKPREKNWLTHLFHHPKMVLGITQSLKLTQPNIKGFKILETIVVKDIGTLKIKIKK